MRKRLLLILVLGAATTGVASPALAATCTFQGPGSDWHTAANWNCGAVPAVPNSTDDVVIPFPEAVEVRLVGAEANSIDLDSGADLVVGDGAELSITGTAPSSLAGTIELHGHLRLAGATSWSGGMWRLDGGWIWNSGTLSIVGNQTARDLGEAVFLNLGTVNRTSGVGEVAIEPRFDNDGTVTVQSGPDRPVGRRRPHRRLRRRRIVAPRPRRRPPFRGNDGRDRRRDCRPTRRFVDYGGRVRRFGDLRPPGRLADGRRVVVGGPDELGRRAPAARAHAPGRLRPGAWRLAPDSGGWADIVRRPSGCRPRDARRLIDDRARLLAERGCRLSIPELERIERQLLELQRRDLPERCAGDAQLPALVAVRRPPDNRRLGAASTPAPPPPPPPPPPSPPPPPPPPPPRRLRLHPRLHRRARLRHRPHRRARRSFRASSRT